MISYIESSPDAGEEQKYAEDPVSSYSERRSPLENFEIVDNYMEENKSLLEEGKLGLNANLFNVYIKDFRPAIDGTFVEYEIEIEYLRSQGVRWQILKRYTDFVALHRDLVDSEKISNGLPRLPPKIEENNVEALERRKKDLEQYLQRLLSLRVLH